jgi:hypothetical protein
LLGLQGHIDFVKPILILFYIIRKLQKHQEHQKKKKKQEKSEVSPSTSNKPIDLRSKSSKKGLIQPSITNVLHIKTSTIPLPTYKSYKTSPTSNVLPSADTPTKLLPPCLHQQYTSITPIDLSTMYPLPIQSTNIDGPTSTKIFRPPQTKQSIITSYFTPMGSTKKL